MLTKIRDSAFSKIALATTNSGKINDFKKIFDKKNILTISQNTLGVSSISEPYGTFVENALHKARNLAQYTDLPVLADDSGICVQALGGQPGVRSARFSGEDATASENNSLLLKNLRGEVNRAAYYYCVIILINDSVDPRPKIFDGEWHGFITESPKGHNGFGYDPIFFDPKFAKTAAELSDENKNLRSHRGEAIGKLLNYLKI